MAESNTISTGLVIRQQENASGTRTAVEGCEGTEQTQM